MVGSRAILLGGEDDYVVEWRGWGGSKILFIISFYYYLIVLSWKPSSYHYTLLYDGQIVYFWSTSY